MPDGQTVPHVRLDALAVEEHVGREDLSAEQIVDDERRDVALTPARVLGRPVVVLFGGVALQAARIASSSCASVNT